MQAGFTGVYAFTAVDASQSLLIINNPFGAAYVPAVDACINGLNWDSDGDGRSDDVDECASNMGNVWRTPLRHVIPDVNRQSRYSAR